jgi:hypothetical protein
LIWTYLQCVEFVHLHVIAKAPFDWTNPLVQAVTIGCDGVRGLGDAASRLAWLFAIKPAKPAVNIAEQLSENRILNGGERAMKARILTLAFAATAAISFLAQPDMAAAQRVGDNAPRSAAVMNFNVSTFAVVLARALAEQGFNVSFNNANGLATCVVGSPRGPHQAAKGASRYIAHSFIGTA